MDNYKNKIIQLINSNAIVSEEIYKELYNNIIFNIKTNNILLENSIIDTYDEKQIFYIFHSNIFIWISSLFFFLDINSVIVERTISWISS